MAVLEFLAGAAWTRIVTPDLFRTRLCLFRGFFAAILNHFLLGPRIVKSLRVLHMDFKVSEAGDGKLAQAMQHLLEQREGFLLIFRERVALAEAAQMYSLP